jgi:modulator of FtsH protease HflC
MAHSKQFISILILLLVAVLLGFSLFVVDATEQAVVDQFGNPVRVILNPIEGDASEATIATLKEKYAKEGIPVSVGAGLYLKIPFLQTVTTYDRRLLRWNGVPEQIPTKDKKYIWVDCTARWYIRDPLEFKRSGGTEEQAHSRLDDIINSSTKNSITKRDLIEIVRTDNRKMRVAEKELEESTMVGEVTEGRPVIVAEITNESMKACEEYGIGIYKSGVLIKGLTYVEDVKKSVEDRMIAERTRIAKKHISEGEGEYERIMGDKERDLKTILSGAYKEAQEIEGQADAEASKIYADTYGQDAEFYQFWKTLRLYEEENFLGQGTRLILGTDNPLFGLIKGDPLKTSKK